MGRSKNIVNIANAPPSDVIHQVVPDGFGVPYVAGFDGMSNLHPHVET